MGAHPHQRRPHTRGVHTVTSQPRLQRWRGTRSRCGPAQDPGGPARRADLARNVSAPAPRAFGDLRRGHFKGVLAACAPRAASLVHCQSGHPAGVLTPRAFPRQAEGVQQWRPGAVLSKAHLSRHCGPHRPAQAPQRTAPRAVTVVPRSAAHAAPSGRQAEVTETTRSPRPQSQWARLADSAPRHARKPRSSPRTCAAMGQPQSGLLRPRKAVKTMATGSLLETNAEGRRH